MSSHIDKNYTYALVGASNDKNKYGNIVFRDLTGAEFNVVPINPKGGEIEGIKAYPTLSDFSEKIDVVVFVVPSPVTEKVLLEVSKLGIDKVWMQPGSESDGAIKYCENNNIDCKHHMCIMVERKK